MQFEIKINNFESHVYLIVFKFVNDRFDFVSMCSENKELCITYVLSKMIFIAKNNIRVFSIVFAENVIFVWCFRFTSFISCASEISDSKNVEESNVLQNVLTWHETKWIENSFIVIHSINISLCEDNIAQIAEIKMLINKFRISAASCLF